MVELTLKSIAAGFCIGLAAMAKFSIANPYIGAFIFCFGLLMVAQHNFKLITGVMGNLDYRKKESWDDSLVILFNNFNGILIICCLYSLIKPNFSSMLDLTKLAIAGQSLSNVVSFCIKAFLCGAMVHAGIDSYRKDNTLLLILCVMLFVLCGFEHCVVNMIYFIYDNGSWTSLFIILLNIIFNGLGAKTMYYFLKENKNV